MGRYLQILIAILVLLPLSSCEREERQLHAGAPSADPVYTVQLSTVVPGTQPTSRPAVSWTGPVRNNYESNAYAMNEGQRLYETYNCKTCHANGGGDIGPPLLDDKWIYGSQPEQIFATIVQGRPNGMPAYGSKVPEYQVWELVAFVRSMSGLTRFDAAPQREDHIKSSPPPTSADPEQPKNSSLPKSAEGTQ